MQAESRIYATAARDRIVAEGDPAAAFLVAAGPGDDVPPEYAQLYRAFLEVGAAVAEAVKSIDVQPASTKARAKAEDK